MKFAEFWSALCAQTKLRSSYPRRRADRLNSGCPANVSYTIAAVVSRTSPVTRGSFERELSPITGGVFEVVTGGVFECCGGNKKKQKNRSAGIYIATTMPKEYPATSAWKQVSEGLSAQTERQTNAARTRLGRGGVAGSVGPQRTHPTFSTTASAEILVKALLGLTLLP